MRVAVAGVTGFLGAAIVRALADHDVVPIGRDLRGGRCDALVWAAGRRGEDLDSDVHVSAPVRAIEVLAPARVIYLSSGECYGAAPVPFHEDGPLLAESPYARAKLAGERAIAARCHLQRATAISLRIGVAFGPRQPSSMLVSQVIDATRFGRRIALSDGLQTRDFVFVDDVARAVAAAVTAPLPSTTINIGSGRETRIRDICIQIARRLGAPERLLGFGDRATRPHEQNRYVLDIERARKLLAWTPITSLGDGLELTIRQASA